MPHNSNRLEKLIAEHQTALYRAALSVAGNVDDAEDAVQEAYLKFLEKRPRFDDRSRAKAWLLRVTVNAALDRIRERKRHPTEELLDAYPAPDQRTYDIMSTVLELPANERAAIHLFYFEGYQTDEIAKILSCRPGTARSYLSRAREKLRQKLEGDIEL